MEKKRIGNDRHVRVAVTRKGRPESFADKELTIEVWCERDKVVIREYQIIGNIIDFIWFGTEQTRCGKYSITIFENYGEKSQNVVDSRPFVELVPRSFSSPEGCGCEMEEGDLSLSVDIDSPVVVNDYNNLNNLPTINGKEIKGNLSLEDLGIINDKDLKPVVSKNVKRIKNHEKRLQRLENIIICLLKGKEKTENIISNLLAELNILKQTIADIETKIDNPDKGCECDQPLVYDKGKQELKVNIPVELNYDESEGEIIVTESPPDIFYDSETQHMIINN